MGRQHKMSRTANGWIPSAKYQLEDIAEEIEVEDAEASPAGTGIRALELRPALQVCLDRSSMKFLRRCMLGKVGGHAEMTVNKCHRWFGLKTWGLCPNRL